MTEQPIATRVMKVRTPSAEIDMPIRLFAPVTKTEGRTVCRLEMDWPDGRDSKTGYGVDEFQAIQIAMQMIGSLLYASDEHQAGDLCWFEPGSGYGFPVPKTIRDLLIGHDRAFDGP